jgi:hypothetical protein
VVACNGCPILQPKVAHRKDEYVLTCLSDPIKGQQPPNEAVAYLRRWLGKALPPCDARGLGAAHEGAVGTVCPPKGLGAVRSIFSSKLFSGCSYDYQEKDHE